MAKQLKIAICAGIFKITVFMSCIASVVGFRLFDIVWFILARSEVGLAGGYFSSTAIFGGCLTFKICA